MSDEPRRPMKQFYQEEDYQRLHSKYLTRLLQAGYEEEVANMEAHVLAGEAIDRFNEAAVRY